MISPQFAIVVSVSSADEIRVHIRCQDLAFADYVDVVQFLLALRGSTLIYKDASMEAPRIVMPRTRREPVLWVVDREQWPRACLRAELIERGYNPYGFILLDDALDYFSKGRSPRPEALILELRGQRLTNKSLQNLQALAIPTIVLGGSADMNDPLIRNRKWDVVFKRPFSLGEVADVVERLVPAGPAAARHWCRA